MTEIKPVPKRSDIHIGQHVWAVEKKNYGSGELTEGIVNRILTSKLYHPRGTKVMFEDGTVARVQRLTPPEESQKPQSKPSKTQPEIELDEEYQLR